MPAPTSGFDAAAPVYDKSFTDTGIGRLQRNRVWYYLKKYISSSSSKDILEINCGTGEDALYMASLGHSVQATDLSEKMIEEAKSKKKATHSVHFQPMDLRDLKKVFPNHTFDILFSNFGGLNCVNEQELTTFFKEASTILKPKGLAIVVLMSKTCLWERLYFSLKGNRKKASRRNTTDPISVEVDGSLVNTWYYNPKDILDFSNPWFSLQKVRPVGFTIPPSYLQPYFENKKTILKFLGWLEQKLMYFSWLSPYADQIYIAILEKKMSLLLTHAYYLLEDDKEQKIMKPYPPLRLPIALCRPHT